MGKKKKRSMWAEGESSSSRSSSSTDDKSTDESTRKRSEGRRKNRKKEGEAIGMLARLMEEKMSKLIIKNHEDQCKRLEKLTECHNDLRTQWDLMKDDVSEVRKQLEKFIGSHIDQCKRLEMFTESHNNMCKQLDVHTNGTSTETSASLRSQLNQVQIPRYKLQFQTWQIGESVEKDQIMEISVALVDIYNGETLRNGPLASVIVELVVVDANFDKNDNKYDWSREEFETSIIKKAREENSATRDMDQSLKSIVSNGRFQLVQGFGSHIGSTIFRNSSNRKIRLGVMVVSPTEERVLEGLSKPFLVRGHDRPGRQSNKSNRQRQALVDVVGYREPNGTMPSMQNSSWAYSTQAGGIRPNIFAGQRELGFQGNTTMISQEQCDLIQQYQCMEQTGNNIADGNEWSPALMGFLGDQNFMDDSHVPVDAIGTEFNMDQQRLFPVQLIWNRPNVEPSKHHWNLLDQFMPLHSCQPKSNKWLLLSMLLMSEHFGSLTISKNVMQTRRRGGVLIEPLEPDDSDNERRPLKSKLHNKYRLRFVNKVCQVYFTWEQIKAFDGRDLKVALFDENDMRITSGPLSSASVEVVALHGDFDDGQDSPEEFSRCVVCPRPEKEASILGGDRILVLADGEACLGNAFFQRTSFCARTGMFKLGVMLAASAQAERIQEGISKPFLVDDRPLAGPPLGFRFCRQAAIAAPLSDSVPEDVDESDPLYLPAKVVSDEQGRDLFCSQESPESNNVGRLSRLETTLDRPVEYDQVSPTRRPTNTSPSTASSPDSFPVLPSPQISKGGKSEASAENENSAVTTLLEAEDIEQNENGKARLMEEGLELGRLMEQELELATEELARKEEVKKERDAAEMKEGFRLEMSKEIARLRVPAPAPSFQLSPAMSKVARWFRSFLGKKDRTKDQKRQDQPPPPPSAKRWSFGRSYRDSAEAAWLRSAGTERDHSKHKHAIALAAAAADAAVAAAREAVAVVRLTSKGPAAPDQATAAVRIQTAFRGFLAKKALRALKALVKLQALVRGYLVRRQAAATLHSLQALVRAQAAVRARRAGIPVLPRLQHGAAACRSRRLSSESIETSSHYWYDRSPKIVEVDLGRRASSPLLDAGSGGGEEWCADSARDFQ